MSCYFSFLLKICLDNASQGYFISWRPQITLSGCNLVLTMQITTNLSIFLELSDGNTKWINICFNLGYLKQYVTICANRYGYFVVTVYWHNNEWHLINVIGLIICVTAKVSFNKIFF